MLYSYIMSCLGEKRKYHCGGHSWRGGLFTKQLKKWVKAVFLLGCYGCIFHGTGNSARLCQNFGISGGLNTPTPPRYATEHSRFHCSMYIVNAYTHTHNRKKRLSGSQNQYCLICVLPPISLPRVTSLTNVLNFCDWNKRKSSVRSWPIAMNR
jgi:hypothetical protein